MNTTIKINDPDLSKVIRLKRESSEIEKEFENGLNMIEPIFKKCFPESAELFNHNSIVETVRNSNIVNARKAIAYYLNLHNFPISMIARILQRPKETVNYTIRYFEEEIVVNAFIRECNKAFVQYYYSQNPTLPESEPVQVKRQIKVIDPKTDSIKPKIIKRAVKEDYKPEQKRIGDLEANKLKETFRNTINLDIGEILEKGITLVSEVFERHFGKKATAEMVIEKNRTEPYLFLRMAIVRFLLLHGFNKSEIGRYLKRDHVTILHSDFTYNSQKYLYSFFIDCEILFQGYYDLVSEIVEYKDKISKSIRDEFINCIKNYEYKYREEKNLQTKITIYCDHVVKYEEYILSNIEMNGSNISKICKLMIEQFISNEVLMNDLMIQ